MQKHRKALIVPTAQEDAAINAGIAADPDTYELSDDEIKTLRRMGRPRSDRPKISVTVRYDQDVIEAFKSSGEGWQTRMNAALKDWLRTHKPA
ncbi:BrnA antitoxin family protein [Alcaligenaceae bacterium C4P045]|nr:BrnA antitoxin family protein [Alcaligenaceae bacterium B3P038]MDQ2148109.1 BrnA antitoxin family protein [Alcaligenaceae bacterium C4P045]